MARKLTLQTIADHLGVSRTTVSNAYNRPDQLAPELRERVLATAAELGYSGPDPAARRLRSGGREAIGLLFTESLAYAFSDPGAVLFLQGFSRATEEAGIAMLLLPGFAGRPGTPHHGRERKEAVQEAVVTGFCAYSLPVDDPDLAAAIERRLPLVVVDEPRTGEHTFVGIDDRAGARLAAGHLAELGHRRIGVVSFRTADDGYSGPLTAAREAVATYPVSAARLARLARRARGRRDRMGGRRARGADRQLARGGRCRPARAAGARSGVTAILCSTDQMALGAMRAAARARPRRPVLRRLRRHAGRAAAFDLTTVASRCWRRA